METFVGIAKERAGRVTFVVTVILVAMAMTAQGQILTNTTITLDGSTGTIGNVPEVGPNQFDILDTWGVRRDTNVFHSFSNFDVAAGDTANFTVTGFDPTNRIFARIVSPGGASLIEGTVTASNPNATPGTLNLYLINPDGIMFSSGAVVNVSGSFLAATATSLTFDGGGFFRTDNLNDIRLSLLSSSFPSSISVPSNQSAIEITGSSIIGSSGRGVSFYGGQIEIDNSLLSIGGGGGVFLSSSNDVRVGPLGAIQTIAGGGNPAGDITILASGDIILNGARIVSDTAGALDAGDIFLDAGGSIIQNAALLNAGTQNAGNAGDIFLDAGGSIIQNAGLLNASTQNAGDAGDIFLDAGSSIIIQNAALLNASTQNAGNAGDISLLALRDITLDEGILTSNTAGTGNAGDISLTATFGDLRASNISFINSTGLPTSTGDAGDLTITVGGDATFDTGSLAITASLQEGNAGDITATVGGALALRGATLSAFSGSQGFMGQSGDAGNITITANSLELSNGGTVDNGLANTQNTLGAVATIDIDVVNDVVLSGDPTLDSATGIFGGGGGGGGLITIDATSLAITGEALLESQTLGTRPAGDIEINVTNLVLDSGGSISTSTEGTAPSAAGGDIIINARNSVSIGGSGPNMLSRILAASNSVANAGSIEIHTPLLTLNEGQITAQGQLSGAGGDVLIDVVELAMANQARIRSENTLGTGSAGSIRIGTAGGIYATDSVTLDASEITSFAEVGPAVGSPADGSVEIVAQNEVLLDNGSEITVSVGTGQGGDISIASAGLVAMGGASRITAETDTGTGGRIFITGDPFLRSADSVVSADANNGEAGLIVIDSPANFLSGSLTALPTSYVDAASLIKPSCAVQAESGSNESSFVLSPRKSLSTSPEEFLAAYDAIGNLGLRRSSPAGDTPGAVSDPDNSSVESAALAFRGAKLADAKVAWKQAAKMSGEAGEAGAQIDALRSLAQTHQAAGEYRQSLAPLMTALSIAEAKGDRTGIASALGSLGNAQIALGDLKSAEELLTRGLGVAKTVKNGDIRAGILNNLGNQRAASGRFEAAIADYLAAAKLAKSPVQRAKAHSNAARAAMDAELPSRASRLLKRAYRDAKSLEDGYETVYTLIHLAKTYETLSGSKDHRAQGFSGANLTLNRAIEVARKMGDERSLSYALGNLGALYFEEGRTREALYLTRQALTAATEAEAPESAYRWHWQEGRVLWSKGDATGAVASYQRAVKILEVTQRESISRYGATGSYFRRAVAPVYQDLVSALLESAKRVESSELNHRLLVTARGTLEKFKAAELRDFFKDECVADIQSSEVGLEEVSRSAAVVYPVVLPDRLELLVTLPSGLKQFTIQVSGDVVQNVAREFRSQVEMPGSSAYLTSARALYDWLVRPFADLLEAEGVDTLVFVPDGVLRTIPIAALHDGEQFLIAKYAVAVTPGLSLVNPTPLGQKRRAVLLAGVGDAVQDFPALPSVPKELVAVHGLYGGETLLNAGFSKATLRTKMQEMQPSIVHIASHAVFGGDAQSTFLLTHDGKISMDELSDIIELAKFRKEPIELLVLSACQTAAGDERAALGLAGVAIRAGARSAVGSLWSIEDRAAFEFVTEFYRQLKETGVSKAVAVQESQKRLLMSDTRSHPYYWSPFLMISNWL